MTETFDDLDFASASMVLRRANRFFSPVSRLSTAVSLALAARKCLAKDVLRDADLIRRIAVRKRTRKTLVECAAEAARRRLPTDPPPRGELDEITRPQTDDDLLSLHRSSRLFPESDHVVVRLSVMATPNRGEFEDR